MRFNSIVHADLLQSPDTKGEQVCKQNEIYGRTRMYEQQKLEEARFFFERMIDNQNDPDFTYYLSAFLSAARSVLQILYKKCREQGKYSWYDDQVKNEIVTFFKCKRNFNIHEGHNPQTIKMRVSSEIILGDSIGIEKCEEGKPAEQISLPKLPFKESCSFPVTRKIHFSDPDAPCGGEIFALSRSYLEKLNCILEAARKCGILPN